MKKPLPEWTGDAVFSPCKTYRYMLQRNWGVRRKAVNLLMLNPSTADEMKNDPTVHRCQQRAVDLGFGQLEVTNIFALRSTDPELLKKHPDPVGPDNDAAILDSAKVCDLVICAWGTDGKLYERGKHVLQLLRSNGIKPHCLKLSKDGHPCHPLYLPYSLQPQPM